MDETNLRATALAHAIDVLRHTKRDFDQWQVTSCAETFMTFLKPAAATKPSTDDDIPF